MLVPGSPNNAGAWEPQPRHGPGHGPGMERAQAGSPIRWGFGAVLGSGKLCGMADRIHITDIHCRTYVGIEEWEQRERQEIHLDIELEADLERAVQSDRIEDTVNYRSVTKRVLGLVEEERFALVEHLAGRVAAMVLEEFPTVQAIRIRVEKPGALRFAKSVGVEIRRER